MTEVGVTTLCVEKDTETLTEPKAESLGQQIQTWILGYFKPDNGKKKKVDIQIILCTWRHSSFSVYVKLRHSLLKNRIRSLTQMSGLIFSLN